MRGGGSACIHQRRRLYAPRALCSGGFAGWTHVDGVNGSLAIYDLSGPDFVAPYTTAPTPTTGPPCACRHAPTGAAPTASPELPPTPTPTDAPSEWFLAVYHFINITAGCSPTNAPGNPSPCALGANGTLARRFHVTPASAPASALETIAAYAEHNGMTAAPGGAGWSAPPFPTLREKLSGVGPAFWAQAFQAPLLKLDAVAIGLPYANYSAQVRSAEGGGKGGGVRAQHERRPSPPTHTLPAYRSTPGSRRRPSSTTAPMSSTASTRTTRTCSPPPLPMAPRATWQTGALRSKRIRCAPALPTVRLARCSMAAANSLGHLTMPYFNPTWWDPLSPTLAPLNGAFGPVAALNATGGAYYETYDDKPVPKTCVGARGQSSWHQHAKRALFSFAAALRRALGPPSSRRASPLSSLSCRRTLAPPLWPPAPPTSATPHSQCFPLRSFSKTRSGDCRGPMARRTGS